MHYKPFGDRLTALRLPAGLRVSPRKEKREGHEGDYDRGGMGEGWQEKSGYQI